MSDDDPKGEESIGAPFKEIADTMGDAPVAPAHGIAAIALNMAMKYHDMQMIPDGLTYQQYKMEGRNMRTIGIVDVFETAAKIEMWLLASSQRIAKIVVDAIEFVGADEPDEPAQSEAATDAGPPRPY